MTNEEKFYKYVDWLNANANMMNEVTLEENEAKLKRGVTMMTQIALASGKNYQKPDLSGFENAKKMISEIKWVDLKITEYPVIGLWHGANHKTQDGRFVFNMEWLNEYAEDLDSKEARWKLKLYMDFDCTPLD
jgi:hypothetical protein